MKHVFFESNRNSKKLVIFFSGWGLEENIFKNIDNNGYNALCFYDYRELSIAHEALDIINRYIEKYLISWSMGVMVSSLFGELLSDCSQKIAICGSQRAVDNDYGIPVNSYRLTVDNFSDKVMQRFIEKMDLPDSISKELKFNQSLAEKLEELKSLGQMNISPPLTYDKVLIGRDDKIFPLKNLQTYWNVQGCSPTILSCGHYPFVKYNSWHHILELANGR